MRFVQVLLILGMATLAACSKKSDESGGDGSPQGNVSVDKDGNCSTEFVHDYNMVGIEMSNVASVIDSSYRTDSEKKQALQTAEKACKKFFASHSDVSCKAEVNYELKQVSSADLRGKCDAVTSTLASVNGTSSSVARTEPTRKPEPVAVAPAPKMPVVENPTPNEPIAKPDDSTEVASLKEGQIQMTILDEEKIKEVLVFSESEAPVLSGSEKFFLHNGQLLSREKVEKLIDDPETKLLVCLIESADIEKSKTHLTAGKSVKSSAVDVKYSEDGKLIAIQMGQEKGDIRVVCAGNTEGKFLMKEIREAFAGVAEFTVSK